MNTYDQIKRGAALAFFACAYAHQAEEAGEPLTGEIMDQLPDEIDAKAEKAATLLMERVRNDNETSACLLFERCQTLDRTGSDRELTPELFGHYLAMQAMGQGVGLESFGSEVYEAVNVPYVEQPELSKPYFDALHTAWYGDEVQLIISEEDE